jgi:DNA invertase Pin-like site-specific DNA recombinase
MCTAKGTETMKTAVYVFVSSNKGQDTKNQDPDLQTWAKAQAGEVEDKFTGTTMERPGLEKLLADERAGKVGKLCCWRMDRMGRTAKGLMTLLDELQGLGIGFVSLREGFDQATPAGRLMAAVLANESRLPSAVSEHSALSTAPSLV